MAIITDNSNGLNVPIERRTVENSLDPVNNHAGDQLARKETFESVELKEIYDKLSGRRFQR